MLSVRKLTDQEPHTWTLSGRIDTVEELMQVAEVLDTEVFDEDGGKYFFLVNHQPLSYSPIMYRVRMSAQVRIGCWIAIDGIPEAGLRSFRELAQQSDGEPREDAPRTDGGVESTRV